MKKRFLVARAFPRAAPDAARRMRRHAKNTLSAVFIIAAALAIWYGTAQTIYAVVVTLPLVGNPETAESHWIASFVFDLIGVVCIVLAANPRLFTRVRLRR